MGTVDPAYIDRLQEDIIIACHRLEQTGHESLVITVSEEGHLIFGSQKGKNFIEDKHVFIKDFVLHCQNSKTVVKVETELDENAEIIEDKELINTNSKPKKSLSIGERDLTHEETRDFTHKETGKDGTKTEKEKEGENNVFANLESSAGVETNMFDDDTDDYDDTEALSPVEAKLEAAADSAAVDELAGEESMNVDGDYTVVTVKEEQSEHEAEESSKGNSKRMSDAKVVLKRINMIINSNQSTKLRSKKLKVQKMGKKTKGKDTGTTACDICGKELSCSTAVNRHKICFHSDKKNHECEECGKKFKLPEGLMRHRAVHSAEKEFKCETCTKSFKRLEYLKSHMKTHDPVKPYNCAECGKSFMKKETLDNHERVHSGEKAIECKIQRIDKLDQSDIENYLENKDNKDTLAGSILTISTHQEVGKDFICDICGAKYSIKSSLNRHLKTHDERFKFECKRCTQYFTNEDALILHQKDKHSANTHLCTSCGKTFSKGAHLRIHQVRFHEPRSLESSYQCPFETCNKSFQQKCMLHDHMNIHTGSRPYSCRKCSKQFHGKYCKNRHEKICIGDLNTKCDICGKVLSDLSSLKRHKDGKHKSKMFICHCGKMFVFQSSLNRHQKSGH